MPLETIHMPGLKAKDGKSSSDFQATPEELRTIQERMKDPKFVELMKEYMESLSDPETRAEEEAYLEQAEKEAKEGGDYTFDFIFPRPAFVVELVQPTTRDASPAALEKLTGSKEKTNQKAMGGRFTTGIRSFINFCYSDKVEQYSEIPTQDALGSQWHVPVAVSEKRLEYFFENRGKPQGLPSYLSTCSGNKDGERAAYAEVQTAATKAAATPLDSTPFCYVYDAVFHPLTLSLADRSNRFLCFLVEIAVEQINAGYKEHNGFEFSRLSSAVLCIGYPRNQTIRKKGNVSPFAVDPSAPVLTKPTRNLDEVEKASRRVTTVTTTKKTTHTSAPKRGEAVASSSGAVTNETCGTVQPPVSVLPPFHIKHRGPHVSLSDTWCDPRVTQKKIGVPDILVVSVDFSKPPDGSIGTEGEGNAHPTAKLIPASAIDLSVVGNGTGLQLQRTAGQPYFEGLLVLPFSVEEDPISAKFDKQKRVLTLELKVQAHHHLLKPLQTMGTESTAAAPHLPRSDTEHVEGQPPSVCLSSPSSIKGNETPLTSPPGNHNGVLQTVEKEEKEKEHITATNGVSKTPPAEEEASKEEPFPHSYPVSHNVEAARDGEENVEKEVTKEHTNEEFSNDEVKEKIEEKEAATHSTSITTSSVRSNPMSSADRSSSSFIPPPRPSMLSKDAERVQLMFAKVEEARRAREASNSSAVNHEKDKEVKGEEKKEVGKKENDEEIVIVQKDAGGKECAVGRHRQNSMLLETRREREEEMENTTENHRIDLSPPEASQKELSCVSKKSEISSQVINARRETTAEERVTIQETQHANGGGIAAMERGQERAEQKQYANVSHPTNESRHSNRVGPTEEGGVTQAKDTIASAIPVDPIKEVAPPQEKNGERETAWRGLQEQQDSWMKRVQEAISQEDIREMEAAVRRARKEAEKAKKRYEAVLAQEKLDKKMQAKRAAAPFLNDHIFAID